MIRFVLAFCALILLIRCTRNKEQCNENSQSITGFNIAEFVLDSAMQADTAFTNRDILFKTNSSYSNIIWKIGDDPRLFTNSVVSLKFLSPGSIVSTLSAQQLNSSCQYESFTSSGQVVLLPDDGSIQSPLVGEYHGFNTDSPSDTFTVAVRYWAGARYPWWPTGAYSVDNLPHGYLDTTQNFNGYSRPEIKGIIVSNSYKNMAFDKSGNIPAAGIKGYASLKRGLSDTLIANYTLIDTARFTNTGQLTYLRKTFIGIKK